VSQAGAVVNVKHGVSSSEAGLLRLDKALGT
jgi:hypothetical protein